MSEITINKNNKSITFTHNNIGFSQFGVADEILDLITDLQNQLQQKENIIKEVREYLNKNEIEAVYLDCKLYETKAYKDILEILDKGE